MRNFLLGVLQKMYARRDARVAAARAEMPQPAPARTLESLLAEGEALEAAGNPDGALQCYRDAIGLAPSSALAQVCAGNALGMLGRLDEAESHYRHAIELDPAYAAARLNLGNVLLATGRAADAEAAYRVALRLRRDWAEAWAGLGCALEAEQQPEPAIEAYREALRVQPGHAGSAYNLADLLVADDPEGARRVLEDALARNPGHASLVIALADLQRKVAENSAAVRLYRELLAGSPDSDLAASNLLFTSNFLPEATAASLLAEHRQWGERKAARVAAQAARTSPEPDRRLRVGYVSPDFRAHPVAWFVAPLWRHHDPAAVEVHAYSNVGRPDAVTEELRGLVTHWREIHGIDDAAVARQIVEDRIDILVDLAGHTGFNRLGVFARKPAPLQMTWAGYLSTTGLPAMDYRICDPRTDPPGIAEHWQTETPLRLPHSHCCFQSTDAFPPAPLPWLARRYWTFGSFNQAAKLNEPLLEAWAELLASLPGSRLRIANLPGGRLPAHLAAVFTRRHVAPERLELLSRRATRDEYLLGHNEIDVSLDSFPYEGYTTTCESLLMGVPVATVAGGRPLERCGISVLSTVDLADWAAPSLAELPAMVRRQLADPERLAQLRAELPARLRASTLMDAPRFARDMEALYRDAWRRWCAQQ